MKGFLNKLFPTLGSKIALAVSVVLLVMGAGFVYFAYQTGYALVEKVMQEKAHGIAEVSKSILEHIMLEGKKEHLKDALESAVASHQTTEIQVLNRDSVVVFSRRSNNTGTALSLQEFKPQEGYPGERFLSVKENGSLYEYIMTPIEKKPECFRCHRGAEQRMGYLLVKVAMDDIRTITLKHRTTNMIMTVITFLGLGGVIFLALFFLVIRPVSTLQSQLHRMDSQMEQIEQGELTVFSELEAPTTQDEISKLIITFNKLVKRLNEAHLKLHEVHEAQLVHADRLATVGEMAASIAHEIKNPIAGVLGVLQELNSEMTDDDPHKDIMKEMIVQMERMSHTVKDLLYYARPTSPIFEMVDINQVIERIISLLKSQYDGRQITTKLMFDPKLSTIEGDPKLLQQLFWNVLINAIQAIEQDGKLTISTTVDRSLVMIQIQDTGKGISKSHQSNLFKPFFTTKHKGTGLGLAISKRIVEQHKGRISIDSVEGKGTTVTILLPMTESI